MILQKNNPKTVRFLKNYCKKLKLPQEQLFFRTRFGGCFSRHHSLKHHHQPKFYRNIITVQFLSKFLLIFARIQRKKSGEFSGRDSQHFSDERVIIERFVRKLEMQLRFFVERTKNWIKFCNQELQLQAHPQKHLPT